MELDFSPLYAGAVSMAVLLGVVGTLWAAFGTGRRRRGLVVTVPLLLWGLFVGIPFLAPPGLGLHSVAVTAGMLCVAASAGFTLVALRARQALVSSSGRLPIFASAAMENLERDPSGEVTLQGSIEGDPPLVGPISGVPCLSYRMELFRAGSKGDDLVALEEQACDRLVLTDASGRVAVSAEPRALVSAGAPMSETAATGWLGTPDEDPRLARAVRHLASEDELAAANYRIVERAVRHGTTMTAVGRMVRRAGEPVLVPALTTSASLRFGASASISYRKLMLAFAALAVLSMGAGLALISGRTEPPAEAATP